MRRVKTFLILAFTAIAGIWAMGTAPSYAGELAFFKGIEGEWRGPGEIVAGKYKGTKFTCSLKGLSDKSSIGMEVKGSCRVGVFSQPMSARIFKTDGKYGGQFLDGEKGQGMDVTGGRFTSSRLVVGIKRQKLNATMVARLKNNQKLNVTISVHVQNQLIPVIGMSLDRITRTGALKN
ncbi:MAG: hypothetical protein L3J32_08930 [Rhizobiaceae bacterium]|nr:hypothetical protein [Rhizobiaceae bacterium]